MFGFVAFVEIWQMQSQLRKLDKVKKNLDVVAQITVADRFLKTLLSTN